MNSIKKISIGMAVIASLVGASFIQFASASTLVALAYPGTPSDLGLTTSSNTSGSASTSGSSGVMTATDVNTSVNASANTSASNNTGSTVLGITVNSDGSFNASQASVSANGSVSATTGAAGTGSTMVAAQVGSSNDLALYAQGVLQSDSNVSGVAVDNNHVAVSYYEPAKVFGFIPARINTTAEVDSSGNATLHHSWYRFLTATNDSDIQANISAQAAGSASTFSSAQTKAQLVSDLYAALKAHADANVSASANAAANTSTSGY